MLALERLVKIMEQDDSLRIALQDLTGIEAEQLNILKDMKSMLRHPIQSRQKRSSKNIFMFSENKKFPEELNLLGIFYITAIKLPDPNIQR